jgi:hypothetical protein
MDKKGFMMQVPVVNLCKSFYSLITKEARVKNEARKTLQPWVNLKKPFGANLLRIFLKPDHFIIVKNSFP